MGKDKALMPAVLIVLSLTAVIGWGMAIGLRSDLKDLQTELDKGPPVIMKDSTIAKLQLVDNGLFAAELECGIILPDESFDKNNLPAGHYLVTEETFDGIVNTYICRKV